MKTLIISLLLAVGLSFSGYAQEQSSVPHSFNYQAIARDNTGQIIANQNVSFRISILQGSTDGEVVYQETQNTNTNQFGLANLSIGKGTVTSGNFDDIQWGSGTYYVRVEFDPKGGDNYSLVSTSQMASVPYALYSEKSGDIDNYPPHVALVATNVPQPLSNPSTGMIVYNTANSGTDPYEVSPGLYYNAGTPGSPKWVPISATMGNTGGVDRIDSVGTDTTNTTYGGITQDGNCSSLKTGLITTCPTGHDNTGFGSNTFGVTGSTNPSGTDNTAVGYKSSYSLTAGAYNTAIGSEAMYNNKYGEQNTVLGYQALYTMNWGSAVFNAYNTAIGYQALYYDNPSGTGGNGYENTAVGDRALYENTTGSQNTATGLDAMAYNTKGVHNTSDGQVSLYNDATGSSNTAVGYAALLGVSGNSFSQNTAIGDSALFGNTIGDSNTAVGYRALKTNSSGANNTAIGYGADVTSGGYRYATAIGAGATVSGYNKMALGGSNSASYTFVGIGTNSPSADLVVADAGSPSSNCHIKSIGTSPGISVSSGSFSSSAIATASTDVTGNFSGTAPITAGSVLQISFNKTYNTPPIVILTATSQVGASNITQVWVSSTTTSYFQVTFSSAVATGTLSYNYIVIEPN